ncbi:CCXG family PEP-CTERM protein [Thalassolituus sp. LLYu03]|uniref:CCXG family PEP-CTERM protein n=1 Tax=Thalassolituus sp. LLYu03 TaxID=3421656 RepID=UPI003D28FDDC
MPLLAAHQAAAYDFDWLYKTELTVTTDSAHSDYYVRLALDSDDLYSGYSWSEDGADLRIVDDDETELDFYIESWSSSGSAVVWVVVPELTAATAQTLYLYYGNTEAASAASAEAPQQSGILYHSRYSTGDPSSLATALSLFAASADGTSGYGSTLLTAFTSVSNSTVISGGASINFLVYSLSTFTATTAGSWSFRVGVDFGRGGALYVDGVAVEEQWSTDMWWGADWTSEYATATNILQGSATLSAGQHTLMLIGAEDGSGGVMAMEYLPPGGSTWMAYSTANLTITSYNQYRDDEDPDVVIVSSGRNLTEGVDLVVSMAPASVNWLYGSGETISVVISAANMGTQTLTSTVSVSYAMANGLSGSGYTTAGGWNCTLSTNRRTYTCTNSTDIASGGSLTPLTLTMTVATSVTAGDTKTYSVAGSLTSSGSTGGGGPGSGGQTSVQTDADTTNNTASGTVAIIDADFALEASGTGSCSGTLTSGLLARFFDATAYGNTFAASASDFQTMVGTYSTSEHLVGQTLVDDINENYNGNPFDTAEESGGNENYFLALLQGYLYVASDGVYGISPDGDDIVEIWLDDELISGIYGNHRGVVGEGTYSADVWLAAGYHKLEFRHHQTLYGQARYLYWDDGSGWAPVDESLLFQCDGISGLSISSSVSVLSDPVNGSDNPKAIPGSVLTIDVLAENTGTLSSDPDSTAVIQAIDTGMAFYAGTSGSSPVTFTDGSGDNASGLTLNFSSLSDSADGLDFSDNDGVSFDYTPAPDSNGYDAAITHFRLTLSGSLKPAFGTLNPQFEYQYQAQVQ